MRAGRTPVALPYQLDVRRNTGRHMSEIDEQVPGSIMRKMHPNPVTRGASIENQNDAAV